MELDLWKLVDINLSDICLNLNQVGVLSNNYAAIFSSRNETKQLCNLFLNQRTTKRTDFCCLKLEEFWKPFYLIFS